MKLTRRDCPKCGEREALFSGMTHPSCGYTVATTDLRSERFGNARRKSKPRWPQKGRPKPPSWAVS